MPIRIFVALTGLIALLSILACKDARTGIYIASKRQGSEIKDIEDYSTRAVEVKSDYAKINCTGVATYKHGRSEPITYWVRKNAGMDQGTSIAGYY